MKIMFLIYSLEGGGAERATVNLADHFAAAGGREVTVATFTDSAGDAYKLSGKIRRVELGLSGPSSGPVSAFFTNAGRVLKIRKAISEAGPDVVIAEMPAAGVLGAFAAVGLGPRFIIQEQIHPPRMPLSASWEFLRRKAYPMADRVVALTEKTAGWFRQNYRLKNVSVIPNPVTYPLEKTGPDISPEKITAENRRFILSAGRLDGQKGFDLLIKIFSSLSPAYPGWDLVILGEGKERGALERQIRESGLEGRIFLPGRAGNLADWYGKAEIYALSSRFEGFPNVLAEAMAYSLPAVSFDCETGPAEMIADGVNGFLVPPEDTAAFAASLGRLMSDGKLRERMSAEAVSVRERFSISAVAALWEKIL